MSFPPRTIHFAYVQAHFCLEGEDGLLAFLEEKLATRGHVLVCVADGAGKVGCHGPDRPRAGIGRRWASDVVAACQ